MAVQIAVGSVTGAAPSVTITPGFQTKLAIIYASLGAGAGFSEKHAFILGFGRGNTASETHQFCEVFLSDWNGTAFFGPRQRRSMRPAEVVSEINHSGLTDTLFSIGEITATTIRLDRSTFLYGSSYDYMLIGGDDVEVAFGSKTFPTSGALAITGAGFQPDWYLLIGGKDGNSANGAHLSLGGSDGTRQWVNAWQQFGDSNGGAGTTNDVNRYARTSKTIAILDDANGALLAEAEHASMDADGFTLTPTTYPASAQAFKWIAVRGVTAHFGSFTQPVGLTAQAIQGLDVLPVGVLLTSSGYAASTIVESSMRVSLGFSDGVNQRTIWQGDNDAISGIGNRRTVRYRSSTKAFIAATPTSVSSGTVVAEGTVGNFRQVALGGAFDYTNTLDDGAARQMLFLALGTPVSTVEVDFGELPQQSGEVIGLSWVELTHVDALNAAKTYLWAPVDLIDPITYYGGYKEPRVLAFGEVNRGLSDKHGNYEAAEWSWVQSDTDRIVRAMFANPNQRHLINRMALIRMIDDESRRLLKRPRLLVRGLVRDVRPRSPLLAEFLCRDFVASQFGSADLERQIPQRVLSRVDFPDIAKTLIQQPVPIIYGLESDAASATDPPVIYSDPAIGAFSFDPLLPVAGYAPITSGAAVPTSVATTLASGGTLSTDVPNGQYGVIVTAVDANGIETDPQPYYYNIPAIGRGSFAGTPLDPNQIESPDGTQKIQVSWAAAAGAVAYRAYLGWYYFGMRFTQMIEVTAPTTSCEFTANPAWGDVVTPSNISAGADLIAFGWFGYYAVTAVMSDGETAMSVTVFGASSPYRRPVRLQWNAVAGASGYKVYRRRAGATWDRVASVAPSGGGIETFDDDLLDTNFTFINGAPSPTGQVPVIHVGTRADVDGFVWEAFLIAGHALRAVDEVYQGGVRVDPGKFGVTWAVPGQSGYSTYFPNTGSNCQYLDINGRRYTLLFVRGPDAVAATDGSAPITVNVQGIESVGDSSGTLITSLAAIYKHLAVNWLFQSYQSGAWLTAPNWPTDVDGTVVSLIDEPSFDALAALHGTRISGGYDGAIVFGANGEALRLREVIARMNLSCDCRAGFNRNSQFFVVGLDLSASTLAAARSYTQTNDITAAPFVTEVEQDDIENVVSYSFRRRYALTPAHDSEWEFPDQEIRDVDAIRALNGDERYGPTIHLHAVRSAAVANDIATRRLDYYKEPPLRVTFVTNLKGLSTELGDVITVDHIAGLSSTGWTAHPLVVLRHVTNPSKYTVRLETHAIGRLYDLVANGTLAWMVPEPPSPAVTQRWRLRDRARRRASDGVGDPGHLS